MRPDTAKLGLKYDALLVTPTHHSVTMFDELKQK